MNSKLIRSMVVAGFVMGHFGLARAQTPSVGAALMPPPPGAISVQSGAEVLGFQFVSGEPAISTGITPVVSGAPFSLEASIKTAHTLPDGNRIVHQQTVHLYRDSLGRTRREETLAAIGPWAASGTPPTMITIQDPISGASYFLDPQRKTATKLPAPPTGSGVMVTAGMANGDAGLGPVTASVGPGAVSGGFVSAGDGQVPVLGFSAGPVGARILQPAEKSDSLGKETIVGLSADGTRTTATIPANVIGNERPLDIVRERWYSSDLQIVLRSKQEDPRFGETAYEVTKLERIEPTSSLFEVPSDYKITRDKSHVSIKHPSDAK
jgi:hypothetical protein